jgi:hypothetical protein
LIHTFYDRALFVESNEIRAVINLGCALSRLRFADRVYNAFVTAKDIFPHPVSFEFRVRSYNSTKIRQYVTDHVCVCAVRRKVSAS